MSILSHASPFQLQTQTFDGVKDMEVSLFFPPVMSEINYWDYCISNNIL